MEKTLLTAPYCPSIITWAMGTNQKAKLYSVDKAGRVGLERNEQKMDRPNGDDGVRQCQAKTLGGGRSLRNGRCQYVLEKCWALTAKTEHREMLGPEETA